METVKHTPGPWFIHDGIIPAPKEEKGYVGTYEVLNMKAYEADVKVIGNVIPYGGKNYPDRNTAHANAKLIAAAPDMYEIVKELYDWAQATQRLGPIYPKIEAVMNKITI